MRIVFATHNPNKLKEVQALMPTKIELLSLEDIGCDEDIPETAETIDDNAILKANYVRDKYKMDCFADDTGLEVEALNGDPGVHSARYAGEGKDNEDNIKKLLERLEGKDSRVARFKTVIALNIGNRQLLFTGICKGVITREKRGSGGFGYDPVFIPKGSNKTFAEMAQEEKSAISHRGKALKKLIDYLSK